MFVYSMSKNTDRPAVVLKMVGIIIHCFINKQRQLYRRGLIELKTTALNFRFDSFNSRLNLASIFSLAKLGDYDNLDEFPPGLYTLRDNAVIMFPSNALQQCSSKTQKQKPFIDLQTSAPLIWISDAFICLRLLGNCTIQSTRLANAQLPAGEEILSIHPSASYASLRPGGPGVTASRRPIHGREPLTVRYEPLTAGTRHWLPLRAPTNGVRFSTLRRIRRPVLIDLR